MQELLQAKVKARADANREAVEKATELLERSSERQIGRKRRKPALHAYHADKRTIRRTQ